MRNRCLSPHRPMAEQSANDTKPFATQIKFGEEIDEDVVVIACIECDLLCATGLHNRTNHIKCLVSVERRDLDGHNVIDLRELPPEFEGQNTSAYRWLQIKTNDRQHRSYFPCVLQKLGNGFMFEVGQAQQGSAIS